MTGSYGRDIILEEDLTNVIDRFQSKNKYYP